MIKSFWLSGILFQARLTKAGISRLILPSVLEYRSCHTVDLKNCACGLAWINGCKLKVHAWCCRWVDGNIALITKANAFLPFNL